MIDVDYNSSAGYVVTTKFYAPDEPLFSQSKRIDAATWALALDDSVDAVRDRLGLEPFDLGKTGPKSRADQLREEVEAAYWTLSLNWHSPPDGEAINVDISGRRENPENPIKDIHFQTNQPTLLDALDAAAADL